MDELHHCGTHRKSPQQSLKHALENATSESQRIRLLNVSLASMQLSHRIHRVPATLDKSFSAATTRKGMVWKGMVKEAKMLKAQEC
jgi:hypothetical protein